MHPSKTIWLTLTLTLASCMFVGNAAYGSGSTAPSSINGMNSYEKSFKDTNTANKESMDEELGGKKKLKQATT